MDESFFNRPDQERDPPKMNPKQELAWSADRVGMAGSRVCGILCP